MPVNGSSYGHIVEEPASLVLRQLLRSSVVPHGSWGGWKVVPRPTDRAMHSWHSTFALLYEVEKTPILFRLINWYSLLASVITISIHLNNRIRSNGHIIQGFYYWKGMTEYIAQTWILKSSYSTWPLRAIKTQSKHGMRLQLNSTACCFIVNFL